MSDFSNTDDVIDVRDIIARVEELREQRTDRFVAGWNMPGYLPDSEPAEFDNANDAREYIADAIEQHADDIEPDAEHPDSATDDDLAQAASDRELCALLRADAQTLRDSSDDEFGATLGQYHYWVTQEGTMGLDDDESTELAELESLLDDLKGNGGDEQWGGYWYPVTLVRDSYFKDYAQELAEDIGTIDSNATWPNNCIDWEHAARELKMDYSSCEFDGVTYFYR